MPAGPLSIAGPPSGARERLLAGMVEVAAAGGYSGASVARVTARAGLSRRSFYRHFSGREDCFAAAYRATVARALGGAARVARATEPPQRPRALLEALLRAAAADPPAARLALLEVQGAPTALRAEHERLTGRIEREIERCLDCGRSGDGAPRIPVTALRAAIEDVVSIRVLRGEAASLPALAADLHAFAEAYRPPPGSAPFRVGEWERLGDRFPSPPARVASRPALLPRGRSTLPPELAADERRSRIVEATIGVAATRGYAAATVAEIAAAARVTKGAFYSHFRSKQDAFLAAQRLGLQESLAAAASAFYAEGAWLDRVWAGLRALLRYLAENPALAALGVREVPAAGAEAIRLEHDIRNAFALFLEGGRREGRAAAVPVPAIFSEAIAGANHGLIRRQVLTVGAERAPGLLPQLTYVTVAPFVGHDAAMAFIVDRVEAASRPAPTATPALA